MTAGRGVEHSETSPAEFLKRGGSLEILQLWLNLPSHLKMTEPRYIGLQKDEIPSISIDGGRAKINLIAESWDGHAGPIDSLTGVNIMTVELVAGGRVTLPAPRGRTVFLYIVRGEVTVAGQHASAFHLVDMNDDGDTIEVQAVTDAVVIFGHAAPLREPIAAQGPFVMNTREEIVQAIRDYQAGNFGGAILTSSPR
jgi:quercetin 2,3-dioxygenase